MEFCGLCGWLGRILMGTGCDFAFPGVCGMFGAAFRFVLLMFAACCGCLLC